MQELYKKIGKRKYQQLKEFEFTAFPSNGILVSNGNIQSFVCSIYNFSMLKVSLFLKRDILIRKLFESNKTAMECVVESLMEPIEEKESHYRNIPDEIIYEKRIGKFSKFGGEKINEFYRRSEVKFH